MDEKTTWEYERLKEDGNVEYAPMNDYDGKITGRIVFGVKAWFDENPEERIRLGWVKHIRHSTKDIEYNRQTQYLAKSHRIIDEWNYEDEWHILDKTPEMMLEQEKDGWWDDNVITIGGVET